MKLDYEVQRLLKSLLNEPFPGEAYEEVDFENGGKGKSVKGQYIRERLNDVFGISGWSLESEVFGNKDGSGVIVEFHAKGVIEYSILGKKHHTSLNFGGCKAMQNHALGDAMKGAQTNLLKKCAAEIGIAGECYKGVSTSGFEHITSEAIAADTEMLNKAHAKVLFGKDVVVPSESQKKLNDLSKDEVKKELEEMQKEVETKELSDIEKGFNEGRIYGERVDGLPDASWVASQTDVKVIYKALEITGVTKEAILKDAGKSRLKMVGLISWYKLFLANLDKGEGMTIEEYFTNEPESEERVESEEEGKTEYPLEVESDTPTGDQMLTEPRTPLNTLPHYKALNAYWKGEKGLEDDETLDLIVMLTNLGVDEPSFKNQESLESCFNAIARYAPEELIGKLIGK